jgi:hypothetical protein
MKADKLIEMGLAQSANRRVAPVHCTVGPK